MELGSDGTDIWGPSWRTRLRLPVGSSGQEQRAISRQIMPQMDVPPTVLWGRLPPLRRRQARPGATRSRSLPRVRCDEAAAWRRAPRGTVQPGHPPGRPRPGTLPLTRSADQHHPAHTEAPSPSRPVNRSEVNCGHAGANKLLCLVVRATRRLGVILQRYTRSPQETAPPPESESAAADPLAAQL